MVANMLIAALLAAATAETTTGSGARATAEARVTVTIRHAVTLRRDSIETRTSGATPERRAPRACAPTDAQSSGCRLIVYDLP